MNIDTPVPGPADLKRRYQSTLTRETWVPLGVAITAGVSIVGSLVACVLAYSSVMTRVELQAASADVTRGRLERLERSSEEQRATNASRDVLLVGIQRDVAESRSGIARLEKALEARR